MKKLNLRQRAFVAAYAGNATAAAKAAGYSAKTAEQQGSRLYRNAVVRRAIQAREAQVVGKHIKTRTELQEQWSEMADGKFRGRLLSATIALRAGEVLEKSRGGFAQKLEIHGELGLLDLVRESMEKPKTEPHSQTAQEETSISSSPVQPEPPAETPT